MPKRKTLPPPVVPVSEEERISLGFRPKNVPKLTKDDLDFIAIERLNRDLRQAAIALTPNEIRYLVDFYYQCQEDRKRAAAQLRAAAGDAEPNAFLTWASEQALRQEGNIRAALTISSKSSVEGEWMQMIHGIGPVLTAGLLAHIDIRRAPTVTHIWSYAGLNPEQSWLGDAGARELVASVVPEKVKRGYDYGQHVEALAQLAKRRTENMWGIIANLMDEEGHVAGAPVEGVTRAILIKAFAMRPWNAKLKTLCVHPLCTVTTQRGHIPIAEVIIGDIVLTHEGRWKKVTQTFTNHHTGLLYGLRSVNAGNQVAWVTGGHPVYAAKREAWNGEGWHKVRTNTEQSFSWHAAESIEKGWKLSRPVGKDSPLSRIPPLIFHGVTTSEKRVSAEGRWEGIAAPKANSIPRSIQLTPQIMRLIGLYLSEGHITRGYVTWSFHINEHHLRDFIIDTLDGVFGLKASVTENLENKATQVTIGCKPLAQTLARMFGTGSLSVHFPMLWLQLPYELRLALWQGIMDGDGDHTGHYAGSRITTANQAFAKQVVDLGRSLGLSVSLHTQHDGLASRIHINQRDDKTPSARTTETMYYNGPVHNLEVEDDHSYLVEGYAVHNCWKIGDSFTKISNSENDTMYGRIYRDHKALVVQKNLEGGYADLARKTLETRNIQDPETLKTYQAGQLPAGRLDLGARRKAEKMFLSHLHEVLYRLHYLTEPVRPWILRTDPRHTHYIPPPFLDIILAEVERRKRAQGRKPTPLPRTALPDDDDVL